MKYILKYNNKKIKIVVFKSKFDFFISKYKTTYIIFINSYKELPKALKTLV